MEKSNVTPLVPKDKNSKDNENLVSSLSPREIVSELDRFVVGQNKAKKAVAVALRNRWRRQALKGDMKDEVLPKNILMIRRPPRSTQSRSSAASDVYKRQHLQFQR